MKQGNVEIITLRVGQMQTNCYLLIKPLNRQTVIIDPGDDADYIISTIKDKFLKPLSIIATHGHFDHCMAAFELQKTFHIPFYIHGDDIFLLQNMQSSAKNFLNIVSPPPPSVDIQMSALKSLKFKSIILDVIPTPGHTPGSVCLSVESSRVIFVGDLIFAGGGVGRTDFSYSDKLKLIDSVNKIITHREDATLYPGHGEPLTVKEAKMHVYVKPI